MASKIFAPSLRAISRTTSPTYPSRSFQTSTRLMDTVTATAIPVRKPVGAFRGGLFGFLLGSTLTGAGVYYYILDEYKVSNELLTEDIYHYYMHDRTAFNALQAAVQRIHAYVTTLEEKVDALQKKK